MVQNGISVEKQASKPTHDRLPALFGRQIRRNIPEQLRNTHTLVDILRVKPGVGGVSNVGSRYYAMQIWVQPDKLANRWNRYAY